MLRGEIVRAPRKTLHMNLFAATPIWRIVNPRLTIYTIYEVFTKVQVYKTRSVSLNTLCKVYTLSKVDARVRACTWKIRDLKVLLIKKCMYYNDLFYD